MKNIRVLVVDDSLFLRRNLPPLLESTGEIEVVGTAANGIEGLELLKELRPDVVTLDVLMPVMDGLTTLKHIMNEIPTPVVMVSSTTRDGTRETVEALTLGAIDVVTKPSGPVSLDISTIRTQLIEKVKAAYASRFEVAVSMNRSLRQSQAKGLGQDSLALPRTPRKTGGKRLVAIATSTGGPAALQLLLSQLPPNLGAGVVIVQHIANGFVHPLAERLNALSQLTVRQAADNDPIVPNEVLISPSGMHLTVTREIDGLVAHLRSEPNDTPYRPSADVLFYSIAEHCALETCAVVLTGMGDDGARGMRAVHDRGGLTIAQDETTSLIYGMPGQAVKWGGVQVSLPLNQIAAEIVRVI